MSRDVSKLENLRKSEIENRKNFKNIEIENIFQNLQNRKSEIERKITSKIENRKTKIEKNFNKKLENKFLLHTYVRSHLELLLEL